MDPHRSNAWGPPSFLERTNFSGLAFMTVQVHGNRRNCEQWQCEACQSWFWWRVIQALITPAHRTWRPSRPDDTYHKTKQLSKDQYDTEPLSSCRLFEFSWSWRHKDEDKNCAFTLFVCRVNDFSLSSSPVISECWPPRWAAHSNKAKVSDLRMKVQQAWDHSRWILKFRHHIPWNIRTVQWLHNCRMVILHHD